MTRSAKHGVAALVLATAALAAGAGSVAANAPTVQDFYRHAERPFVDCPGFSTVGIWDFTGRLTLFVDGSGTPIRDIEQVSFEGRIVNTSTGAWVADSGARTFFDTLAPDGSYLETYMVQQRTSTYIHTAGRTDFQTGELAGHDGLGDANIAALCEALGG